MSRIMNRQPSEIVGSAEYLSAQSTNKHTEDQFVLDSDIPDWTPRAFEHKDEKRDNYYRSLQSEMMDNGWLLEEDEESRNSESVYGGNKYFTHATYRGKKFPVHTHFLSTGATIMLPLVPQDEDPKGLGCSIHVETNGMSYEARSNRWVSFYEDRKGKRRLKYNYYLSEREKKKKEYEKMIKPAQSKM